MRKVLSFVLVLSLVLGSFGMAFAAPLSDIAGEDYEDAVNVLTELGVLSGYPDGSFKGDRIVTRAEMAVIVVSALGLADYATGTSKFSDMAGHWSNPYVAYATSLGIISGYPDGTFKPDKTVSYDEAATMLVAALGYTPDSLVGTWPVNYVSKAKTLGILDGIKAGAAGANRGDIAIMTYQTLDQNIGKTDKDGVWSPTILQAGSPAVYETLLDRLGAQLYAPTTAYKVAEDGVAGAAFIVDDQSSVISLKNLQGALVTAYANSDNKIIAIKEVKSVFYTGELDAAGGFLAAGDEIGDYEIKSGAIPAAASTTTYAFVNGAVADDGGAPPVLYEVATTPVVNGQDYTVACKISGNYITEIYSIAAWDMTVGLSDEKMVDEDDLEDIKDAKLFAMDFPTDNNDEVDYAEFALFGVESLDDIEVDNVVTVYDNGSGDVARVEVGQEVVEGVISKVTSGGTKATVGGKVYTVGRNAVAASIAALGAAVGDEVELYLDYAGDIHDIKVIDGSDDMLAIVIDYELGVPTKMSDSDSQVRLFLADGTIKTFTVDDDDLTNAAVVAMFSNAVAAKGGTGVVAAGAGIIQVGSVVEYSLDKNGNLNAISLADATGFDATGNVDITAKGTYNGLYIASDATIFTTEGTGFNPQDNDLEIVGTDKDEWGVTTLDKIVGTEDVKAFYRVDPTSNKIVWMAIEGGTTDEDIFAVYNDYARVDTDAGFEVYVLVDGVEKVYEANSLAKAEGKYDHDNDATTPDVTAAGVMSMFKLVLGTDGNVSKWEEVTNGGDITRTPTLGVATANTVKNNVLTIGGTPYALDSDIVVYTWSATDIEWSKATASALRSADYTNCELYDVDGDLIYDYALVW